ncbi:2-dehydro-3-deoxygluconokinase [Salinimicrobium sediminis]|uniref:2-dehydro-3-deoxygluconokinase n=1 Tax=Salinimicrobium sediminis TaxID=1343891 RepID=A0A285X1Y0_9FLAO|nr:sugar kinase [Salinimicrobium sediminis]SOC79322.1 2-dehydro-3-deoxygluconokinase [Salinimicrobium sediminis]
MPVVFYMCYMQEEASEKRKTVTFGEVLMRLSPSDNRKLLQANHLDFFFGGTEMNVAASLAHLGVEVQHVTNVSNDIVGEAAISTLRKYGIGISAVNKVDFPLGLYFLEVGSSMRSSQVAYNRRNSSFANISPEQVDWEAILSKSAFLHWSGISPAISEGAYQTLKAGLEMASQKGVLVTSDPAYRSNLWKYGRNSKEVLKELISLSNIFIGGVSEINEILDSEYSSDEEGFIAAAKALIAEYPSVTKVFDKVRTSVNASWQKIYGRAWTGKEYLTTSELEITNVVDRIGTGDAFAAGLLYGLQHFEDQEALDFANAACALKHTHVGDVNLVSVEEVLEVANGKTDGRIKR